MNDPELNAMYAQQLTNEVMVKGPYLEGTLPFASSGSLASLVNEGVLSQRFLQLNQDVLPANRPIYAHQEKAIRKVVSERRNLVVATGTGSGKTESFLIPLLEVLFREPAQQRQQSGIRALLLYPMNALANDQLKRLRELLKNTPDVTFGRFTGETLETDTEAYKQFRRENEGETPLPNERLSRESMRADPPDVLITNYAMLEYLLLRPEDTVFFDAPTNHHWSMIVLDEVHTYNGALGVEISMLLRRVKQRIGVKPGQLRCIGTSATIGSLDERVDVARFAETLFGEPFAWDDNNPALQDVVTGERVIVSGDTWGEGTAELYRALYDGLLRIKNQESEHQVLADIIPQLRTLIPTLESSRYTTAAHYGALLHAVLVGDARTRKTQELLREKAFDVATFAELVSLNHADDGDLVVRFIELLLHAKRSNTEKPLLPSRYHVFVKALEGMFVCLNRQGHLDGRRKVLLRRHEICPECEKKVYEISRCTRCGAPYLSGNFTPDRGIVLRTLADFSQPDYLLLENEVGEADEDDTVLTPNLRIESYFLCTSCGIPRTTSQLEGQSGRGNCVCGSTHAVLLHRRMYTGQNEEEANRAGYCVNCGASGAGTSIIMSAETGKDAPVGILASELYQQIPGNPLVDKRGDGRRMIIFADGRQDAAFFAPYLERNYGTALHRRLMLEAITQVNHDAPGEVRLDDVVSQLRNQANKLSLFDHDTGNIQKLVHVRRWITREMIAVNRELTLETQGLLEIRLAKPDRFVAPARLTALGLSADEAWNFVQLLLRTLRHRRVLSMPEGVSPGDVEFMPGNTEPLFVRKNGSAKRIFSWLPVRTATNARLEMTLNILRELQPTAGREAALEILAEVWDLISNQQSSLRGYLVSESIPSEGVVYQLNYKFHELVPYAAPTGYQCTKCRSHTYVQVRGVCTVKRCTGTMVLISSTENTLSIYQRQYQSMQKTGMTVQEHSANLSSEEARDIQIRFTRGEINVLSCTTTFELGVDVGELQTVFLRNMPPTTANYIQRAGRAGRRDGATAMIVTFCQRRSHDLTYFDNPVAMISGTIPAPHLQTDNTKITRRHLYAMVLASFLRYWSTRSTDSWPRESGKFFTRTPNETPHVSPVVQGLVEFISARPEQIKHAFKAVLTDELRNEFGVDEWGWLGSFEDENNPLYLNSLWKAHQQLNEEFASVEKPLEDIWSRGQTLTPGERADRGRLERMLQTLKKRQLFAVLPNFGLMPKYGFPTDVVQLKTDHIANDKAGSIQLTRDLRIALGEYSPGSQIVAAGRVWESGGIVIPGGRGLVAGKYLRCGACEYVTLTIGDTSAFSCQNCKTVSAPSKAKSYIIPEFGFVARHDSGNPLVGGRPPRGISSRLFFSGETMSSAPFAHTDPFLRQRDIEVFFNRNVRLCAVNEGKKGNGFSYCEFCGYATDNTLSEREHKSPLTGRLCRGSMQKRKSLLHEFVTDVLEIQLQRTGTESTIEWRGVLYAVLEAAATLLNIERDEIDGTVYKRDNGAIRLVVFDTVPGGAGFALQIAERVPMIMHGALRHVDTDCCGPETSCYRCLRTYANEWYHDELKRGRALRQLQMILGIAPA
jgi:ATP-dependent helicase YprA (DUF1998 family)